RHYAATLTSRRFPAPQVSARRVAATQPDATIGSQRLCPRCSVLDVMILIYKVRIGVERRVELIYLYRRASSAQFPAIQLCCIEHGTVEQQRDLRECFDHASGRNLVEGHQYWLRVI